MSYEGYDEYKCRCGNKDQVDCYEKPLTQCSACGERYYKIRSVDTTNDIYKGPWRKVVWQEITLGMYTHG
jgi:hypothetical protein